MRFISIFLASFWVLSAAWAQVYEWKAEGNPVVRHKYTADPALWFIRTRFGFLLAKILRVINNVRTWKTGVCSLRRI